MIGSCAKSHHIPMALVGKILSLNNVFIKKIRDCELLDVSYSEEMR